MLAEIAHLICIAGGINGRDGKPLTAEDFARYLRDEPSDEPPTTANLAAAFGLMPNG